MKTWEYKTTESIDEVVALGKKGWELVAVIQTQNGEILKYLKRPRMVKK